jgi:hypothetical protein
VPNKGTDDLTRAQSMHECQAREGLNKVDRQTRRLQARGGKMIVGQMLLKQNNSGPRKTALMTRFGRKFYILGVFIWRRELKPSS